MYDSSFYATFCGSGWGWGVGVEVEVEVIPSQIHKAFLIGLGPTCPIHSSRIPIQKVQHQLSLTLELCS
jgi:hypothetical protein